LIARLFGGAVELPAGLLVRYAFVLGALGGLAEALYLALRQLIKHQPAAWYNSDVLWMAPLAAAATYALLAILLALLARAAGARIGLAKATFLFVLPSLYGITQLPGIALHPVAELVLSVGIAVAIGRAVSNRPVLTTRVIRQATPIAGIALIMLIVWAVLGLPRVAERRALGGLTDARRGAPNVLLIILDTVRAANLSLYGYHRATSPHTDAWAGSGVVFDRAISTAPWTLPAHATMFTGHYNFTVETGVNRALDARYPTLAEVLRDRGYATAAFTANLGYTARTSGLHRGFVRYEDFPVTTGMFLRSAWLTRQISNHLAGVRGFPPWPIPKRAESITDDFLTWVEARHDRPFFVFLNYYDAHGPYDAPAPWRTRFGPPPEEELTSDAPHTPEELATSINAYDGCIAYIDDQLARIFEMLERTGLRENTLVVVTSDHGEMFGEHGQTAHTSGLYMPVLHVPLAMVYPKAVPAGLRVQQPVTLRDLPATILDLIGLAANSPIPGESLATHWTAGGGEATASPLLAELDHYSWAPAWTPIRRGDMKSLVQRQLHYIRNGDGVEELYDAESDPAAARDLIAMRELRPAAERLRVTLDSIIR
jgi:arylsulfatase A-like enzyme